MDEAWSDYYRQACRDEASRLAALRANLGACAFDAPMVFAFLLMLAARGSLPRRAVELERLNRSRQRSGKGPLLEHVVVSAPCCSMGAGHNPGTGDGVRRGPRLHHVCGHLVRRGSVIFWRVPHLRGSAQRGQVRTRTVELSFAPPRVA